MPLVFLKNEYRQGRPKVLDSEDMDGVVAANHATTVSEKFNVSHTTVLHQLKTIGKVSVVNLSLENR